MSKRLTRGVAIKKYCRFECCANDLVSWRNCSVLECPLWRFRMGKEQSIKKDKLDKKKSSITPISQQKTLLGVEHETTD